MKVNDNAIDADDKKKLVIRIKYLGYKDETDSQRCPKDYQNRYNRERRIWLILESQGHRNPNST